MTICRTHCVVVCHTHTQKFGNIQLLPDTTSHPIQVRTHSSIQCEKKSQYHTWKEDDHWKTEVAVMCESWLNSAKSGLQQLLEMCVRNKQPWQRVILCYSCAAIIKCLDIAFRLFCFLWCDGLLGSLQAGLATQRRLRSDQLPQDSCKTGSDLFRGKKKPSFVKLLSPGAQCPDHLWRPDRLDGTWPLALQEGDAHMEDMGESSIPKTGGEKSLM